jgi:hypothetical protein
VQITVVGSADLQELLPLLRAYCDFYQVAPVDQALLELSQALLADPQREGLQLLARDDTGRAVGFATLLWTWQTLAAARVGVMNDLYVAAAARGVGWPTGSSPPAWSAAASRARPSSSGRRRSTTTARRRCMSRLGRPTRTAGWTTSCRLILADLWRPRDGPPMVRVVRGRETSLITSNRRPRVGVSAATRTAPAGAVLPPVWTV